MPLTPDSHEQYTIRKSQDLLKIGLILPNQVAEIDQVNACFSMAVTPDIMALIDLSNPNDAIARQFIPNTRELQIQAEELADPIGDAPHTPVKGITHRYPDRVLLKPVHVCPVYCRFCFRREVVGNHGEGLSPDELEAALSYIRTHPEIWEVILTGGDPLILSKAKLSQIIQALDQIDHLDVIRIHTRVLVVDPSRIDGEIAQILRVSKPVYVVLHTNHPQEFSDAARRACATLVDAGIPMLSQTVLLKGINDSPEILTQLFRTLIRNRIKPYYLHHADLAKGTSHFRTTIQEGQTLLRALRGRVSGICQPTYVLDIPGGYGKVPIGPQYLQAKEGDNFYVEDPWSEVHVYPPLQ
ncbi:MAG: lysine-2,3-aminomutase-like protein [Stigonema ocellatum SAG 48.90 = DSM 106950]|nr:lysine-2,3-aminomutase-like protein [Stigonema ocellatum SAG 48.90 = DSM 106950]